MGYGIKHLILGTIGGFIYTGIELLWRGHSHWTMFIVGAIAFLLIGCINEFYTWDMPLWLQCAIAAVIITFIELVTGMIVNVWLGWGIWDYRGLRVQFMGQISLLFSVVWYFLSFFGIVLDDVLRWILFEEEKPRYRLF